MPLPTMQHALGKFNEKEGGEKKSGGTESGREREREREGEEERKRERERATARVGESCSLIELFNRLQRHLESSQSLLSVLTV